MSEPRWRQWTGAIGALLVHPSLWPVALRQLFVLAPPGWWRRPPFLPLPDGAYLRFRMQTAYGAERTAPTGHDLVTYLRWCKAQR